MRYRCYRMKLSSSTGGTIVFFLLSAIYFIKLQYLPNTTLTINNPSNNRIIEPMPLDTVPNSDKKVPANTSQSESNQSPDQTPSLPPQSWVQANIDKVLTLLKVPPPKYTNWDAVDPLLLSKTYYNKKTDVVYTGIPKAGCTNWKKLILDLEGVSYVQMVFNIPNVQQWPPVGKTRIHEAMSKRSLVLHNVRYLYNNKFSFTFIRNPWTRMVSGYRDKLAKPCNNTATCYVERFKKGKVLLHILQTTRDQNITIADITNHHLRPTFEEFLAHLVTDGLDEINAHFKPQTAMLGIQHVRYSFIGAIEHIELQSKTILSQFNTSERVLSAYDGTKDARLESSTLLAKEWFSNVPKELIQRLYLKYETDFMIYNYSNFDHPQFPYPLYDEPDL